MEALIPYLPFTILVIIIVIIVRWRRSVRYLKHGDTKSLKPQRIEPRAESATPGAKPTPSKPKRRKRAGPYPGIELGKRIIYGGVELKRLDKETAADIEGRSDVHLHFDIEPEGHQYAGAFAVWAKGPRIHDFLGYLPKDIAAEIREHDVIGELSVRVDRIWIGDRGGAIVSVNVDGPPSVLEKLKASS